MATNKLVWNPIINDFLPADEDPNNLPAPPPISSLPGYIGSGLDPNSNPDLIDPEWNAAQAGYAADTKTANDEYTRQVNDLNIQYPRILSDLTQQYGVAQRRAADQAAINGSTWSTPALNMYSELGNQYQKAQGDIEETKRQNLSNYTGQKTRALGTAQSALDKAQAIHAGKVAEAKLKADQNAPPTSPLAQGPTTTPTGQYVTGSVGAAPPAAPDVTAGQPSPQNVADMIAQSYWEGINNPFYSAEQQSYGRQQVANLINSPMQAQLQLNPLWDAIRQRLGL